MTIRNCWIITEGIAGTENQCIAVAETLGVPYTVKRVGLRFPFNSLCPHILKKAPKWAIEGIAWDDEDNTPAPDLIIASGRKAVPVALHYDQAFTCFIQNPRINPKYFDLVVVPDHDDIGTAENIFYTRAAPNRITKQVLKTARESLDLSHLPKNKIAILIGGNSKSHSMPATFAQDLYAQLLPYLRMPDWGVMITASRRTPEPIFNALRNLFDMPNCVFWDGTGDNPYHAYLAWADYILVTEDSTSMISDALTTGAPSYRLPLVGGSEKFTRLYQNLKRRCRLDVFDGELKPIAYKPLNDAEKVADILKKRFERKS